MWLRQNSRAMENKLTYGDSIKALRRGDYETMNEATLWMLYGSLLNNSENEVRFALITSWDINAKEDLNDLQNQTFRGLRSWFANRNYRPILLHGIWKPSDEPSKSTSNEAEKVIQPAFFVRNVPYKDALEAMKGFNQKAILYSGPEFNDQVTIVYYDGSHEVLGEFSPKTIKSAWDRIQGGRSLSFQGFYKPPSSWIEALLWNPSRSSSSR